MSPFAGLVRILVRSIADHSIACAKQILEQNFPVFP